MNGAEEVTGVLRQITPMVLLQLVLILLAAWLLIYLVQRVLPWVAERVPGRYRVYLLASVPVLRLSVIVAAVALLVPRIIQPTFENLVTLLGALGIAIGFAFKDYVSSLIAGIVTLYEMPYHPGDWIEIEGVYGEVRTIGMRAVEICTPDDAIVVIPHLKLWDKLIKNANDGSRDLMCIASFYLHPRHDPARVRTTLHEVALTSPYVQLRRPIQVLAEEQPWATRYWIKAYPVDLRHQFQFTTDLTLRGKAALRELGVEFAAVAVAERTDTS